MRPLGRSGHCFLDRTDLDQVEDTIPHAKSAKGAKEGKGVRTSRPSRPWREAFGIDRYRSGKCIVEIHRHSATLRLLIP
jgi:hypothetical protein